MDEEEIILKAFLLPEDAFPISHPSFWMDKGFRRPIQISERREALDKCPKVCYSN